MDYQFEIGDILIVSSTKEKNISSYLNYNIQKIGTFKFPKNFNFTHVILSLSKGLFIESTIKSGVDVLSSTDLTELFKTQYKEDFIVIRNKNLNEEQKKILFKASEYFYQQKYNYLVSLPSQLKNNSYCSELIKNIFKKINIKIKSNSIYATWPIHFYELTKNEDWVIVTEYYKILLNEDNRIENNLAVIFRQFHSNMFNLYKINTLFNNYQFKYSFYDVLYNENLKQINKESFKSNDIKTKLFPTTSVINNLLNLSYSIEDNYKKYKDNLNLNILDIQLNWKIKTSVKQINNNLTNEFNLLKKGLDLAYKNLLVMNSQLIFDIKIYFELNPKEQKSIKEFIEDIYYNYFYKDMDKLYSLINSKFEENITLLSKYNDENLILTKIIKKYNLVLFILLEVNEKCEYLKKDIEKILIN